LGDLSGTGMTALRHHLRLSWIALVAIVGILSTAGGATASVSKTDTQGPGRACCIGRVCAKCCCPPASGVSNLPPTERSATVSPVGARLSTPAPLCECRPGGPDVPASKSEPRSSENRDDQVRALTAELIVETRPAITPVHIVLSPAVPPKSPLYLRTSRLLI
jgi:hypothetical protein